MTNPRRNARLKPVEGRNARRSVVIGLLIAGVLLSLGLLVWGTTEIFGTLHRISNEQCRVSDADVDIVIVTPNRMVPPEAVIFHFGLTNGANLAEIDFAGLREKMLARIPNVRDIRIERRLPNRVTIEVKEREPIARVASTAKNSPSGLMVDAEGVIFRFARSAAVFPVVRTGPDVKIGPGERLVGRAAAALQLVEAASQPDLLALNVQEVNASPKDYVMVTLGNYSRAKVAWDRMDENTALSRESLQTQLRRLLRAQATGLASSTATWIVTDYGTPGRVYAAENDR